MSETKSSSGNKQTVNSPPIHTLIPPAPDDPIRIVPLKLPQALVADEVAPSASLTYRGGPLIKNVEVYTIFWGFWWQAEAEQTRIDKINTFFKTILKSQLIDQISSEYSTPQYPIGYGSFIGTKTITEPRITHSVTDSAIQAVLQSLIANNTIPAPDMNKLYFVYLPLGVVAVQGGSKSCQSFCGYHDNISHQIFYAVMPNAGCDGCTDPLNSDDALLATSSHELCEAITDPIPGTGWYNDYHGEVGDYCAWQMKPTQVSGYTVQKEWSNKQNACV